MTEATCSEPQAIWDQGAPQSTCLHISELAALPPPDFIVDGLYVAGTFNLLYGPPKSGKTYYGNEILYDLSLGDDHFGRKVKQQGALILAGEAANAIGLRARALAKHRDIELQDLDIRVETARLDFLTENPTEVVDHVLRAYETLKDPGSILIDPWGKFMRSGDENSSVDVGRAIETARTIMERTQCTLFCVHHTPASTNQRPRGHTSLLADVELAASIVKAGESRTVTVTDARFISDGTELSFHLKDMELDGGVSACVVIPKLGTATGTKKSVRLSSATSLAFRKLHDALDRDGQIVPGSDHVPPLERVVRWEIWRSDCIKSRISSSDKPDSQQKAFVRAADKLKSIGLIDTYEEWVWVADKSDRSGQT